MATCEPVPMGGAIAEIGDDAVMTTSVFARDAGPACPSPDIDGCAIPVIAAADGLSWPAHAAPVGTVAPCIQAKPTRTHTAAIRTSGAPRRTAITDPVEHIPNATGQRPVRQAC